MNYEDKKEYLKQKYEFLNSIDVQFNFDWT